jgi:hypothetical protein
MDFHRKPLEMDRRTREGVWNWRPYLDRDPPHLAPIDGKEYAAHHGGTKDQYAKADRNRLAVRDDHSVKTPKNRKIVEGANDLTRFKHAFQHDAGKATKLKWLPISQTTAPGRARSAARYTNQGADEVEQSLTRPCRFGCGASRCTSPRRARGRFS